MWSEHILEREGILAGTIFQTHFEWVVLGLGLELW